jgi:hypothetical protein
MEIADRFLTLPSRQHIANVVGQVIGNKTKNFRASFQANVFEPILILSLMRSKRQR